MRGSPVPEDERSDQVGSADIDLLVVEGLDAGKRFTLEAGTVLLGSDPPSSGRAFGIRLGDPSIARCHVRLTRTLGGLLVERVTGAPPGLRVNDVECDRAELGPGGRIALGSTVLEACTHDGLSLSSMLRPLPQSGAHPGRAGAEPMASVDPFGAPPGGASESPAGAPHAFEVAFGVPGADDDDACNTQLRVVPDLAESVRGKLEVLRGGHALAATHYALTSDATRIGRSPGSDIHVADRGVSRDHCELRFEGSQLVLVQRSPLNFTFVNGARVTDRATLRNGDRVQIADVVLLEVQGLGCDPDGAPALAGHGFGNLGRAMEERLRIEKQIEAEFLRRGSMLDVDVVGSSEMKAPGTSAAHIILSFERFRDYVANIVREFGGAVLNSNGDELMCFFEDTYAAVKAGSAVLERLYEFNRTQNLLPRPFRFRIGIHTGACLVDLVNGRAFSPLVDLAGHLQKQADENGLLISQDTLDALPEKLPFEPAGHLARHDLAVYRLTRLLGKRTDSGGP